MCARARVYLSTLVDGVNVRARPRLEGVAAAVAVVPDGMPTHAASPSFSISLFHTVRVLRMRASCSDI